MSHSKSNERRKVRGSCNNQNGYCSFFISRIRLHHESGIALVMVLLVVSLASFIVIELTHSSTLEVRSNLVAERNLRSEYLLKSVVNLARAMIKFGTVPGSKRPLWHEYSKGQPIPSDLIGIRDRSVRLSLEIRPSNSSLPLQALAFSGGNPNTKIRDTLVNLFVLLEFDGQFSEEDPRYGNRVFDSQEMVANLIDYIDTDKVSYNPDDFVSGIEGTLNPNPFPNKGTIDDEQELNSIPGFTPNRVRLLAPFVYTIPQGSGVTPPATVNINYGLNYVLRSLDPSRVDESGVQEIIQYAQDEVGDGPFTGNYLKELSDVLGGPPLSKGANNFADLIDDRISTLDVIAKASYGTNTAFMKAVVTPNSSGGGYPKIIDLRIY